MTRPEIISPGAVPHAILRCRLDLPGHFRARDVLAFHGRDGAALAERVDRSSLRKGILWRGLPASLCIRFQGSRASVELSVDGASADEKPELRRLARRMLGLDQDIDAFEESYMRHPLLGTLITRKRGLRIPQAASPFEALGWAITGQQISVSAAISIRRRLILAAGIRHSSGLWCYPGARDILALGGEGLGLAGFSRGKARSLLELSALTEDGSLPLDDWRDAPPIEEIRERLLQIRGIGPWTVSYALLRGFGWLDGSLHGDVAVRRNLQVLLGRAEKLSEDETRLWLQDFSPWRALLAAHLWAMQAADGY